MIESLLRSLMVRTNWRGVAKLLAIVNENPACCGKRDRGGRKFGRFARKCFGD
jgi:hypothetical protein